MRAATCKAVVPEGNGADVELDSIRVSDGTLLEHPASIKSRTTARDEKIDELGPPLGPTLLAVFSEVLQHSQDALQALIVAKSSAVSPCRDTAAGLQCAIFSRTCFPVKYDLSSICPSLSDPNENESFVVSKGVLCKIESDCATDVDDELWFKTTPRQQPRVGSPNNNDDGGDGDGNRLIEFET